MAAGSVEKLINIRVMGNVSKMLFFRNDRLQPNKINRFYFKKYEINNNNASSFAIFTICKRTRNI